MSNMKMVDKTRMKRNNLQLVFQQVYANKTLSRPQLAQLTGMSVMSAGRMADELMALGLLVESSSQETPAQGRPPKMLSVNRGELLSIGLYIDSDGVRAEVMDPYGQTVQREWVALSGEGLSPEALIEEMGALVERLYGACPGAFPTIGVAVPGLIDHRRGLVRYSSQLKWRDVPLREKLEARLGRSGVVVENDIKAWALAEKQFGAAQPYGSTALLSIGSGIGSALVADGAIYRGRNNLAGEIGHITVDPMGRLCDCGKTGCLQTFIGERSLLQEIRLFKPGATMEELFSAYDEGAGWAREIVRRLVTYTGIAIHLLINAHAPEAVVLCGSILERFPAFWQLVNQREALEQYDFMRGTYALHVSDFGQRGNVVGAAHIAFEAQVKQLIRTGPPEGGSDAI